MANRQASGTTNKKLIVTNAFECSMKVLSAYLSKPYGNFIISVITSIQINAKYNKLHSPKISLIGDNKKN